MNVIKRKIFSYKLKYLYNKLETAAKKKYRVVEYAYNKYLVQTYNCVSLTSCFDLFDDNKVKETYEWTPMIFDDCITGYTLNDAVKKCDTLRRNYRQELIKTMQENKKCKKYPVVIY